VPERLCGLRAAGTIVHALAVLFVLRSALM
jgi:hypothetical protein